jgi:hypothetical protein
MKYLMENWRKFINEGIDPRIQKQIDNLPENVTKVPKALAFLLCSEKWKLKTWAAVLALMLGKLCMPRLKEAGVRYFTR